MEDHYHFDMLAMGVFTALKASVHSSEFDAAKLSV